MAAPVAEWTYACDTDSMLLTDTYLVGIGIGIPRYVTATSDTTHTQEYTPLKIVTQSCTHLQAMQCSAVQCSAARIELPVNGSNLSVQADGSAVTTLPYPKAAQPEVAQLHQLLAAVTAAPARQAIPCMQAIACGVGKHAAWVSML